MSARVITDEVTGERRVEVRCDLCATEAPPATEIIAGFGLANMGWQCSGGTHICEDCSRDQR